MDPRAAHRQKLEAKLDRIDVEISRLALHADRARPPIKPGLLAGLRELRRKQAVALREMETMEGAGDHAWEDARQDVERACEDLARAFARIYRQFEAAPPAAGSRPYPAAGGGLPASGAARGLRTFPAPAGSAPASPADPRRSPRTG